MALRINTNMPALNTLRVLNRSMTALNRSMERLSSGLRINRAANDAAGLTIAEGFHSIVRGTAMAQRNVQDGINMIQTAEGDLGEITAILQRMRELSVQAATGTQNAKSRDALDAEFEQLTEQIDAIATSSEFNGIKLLKDSGAITLQVGARVGQTMDVSLTDVTKGALGLDGAGLAGADAANANAAMDAVDAALDIVTAARSSLGAVQNRLGFTMNRLAIEQENAASSESAIRDADMARESIEFMRNQILVNMGVSMLAQANFIPQLTLRLLG